MYYPPSSLIATGIIFGVLCLVSTALRFWVRRKYKNDSIGLDDWLVVVAAIIVTTFNALQVEDTIHGQASGSNGSAKSAVESSKINYFQLIAEKIAYGCIKLSFLVFYRRIFGLWPGFRKINNVLMAVVTAWMLAYFFAAIFVCGTHPAAQWDDYSTRAEKCYNIGAVLFSFAITDVATDVAVLSLPFIYIHRLQMTTRKQWAVAGVFTLGFLSTLAGILRLSFLSVYFKLHQFDWNPPKLENPPKILEVISPIFWTNFELTCGVIAANLPPLWPLIHHSPSFKQLCTTAYRKLSSSSNKSEDSTGTWSRLKSSKVSTMTSVVTEK